MSELAPAAGDGVTAGQLLRRAREAAGLHVAALAVSLKVPVRKLEALEEDRYDLLPDAVFVRALASSVCRTLKIDAQPILQRLPQTAAPRLVQEKEGINVPFRAPGDTPRAHWMEQLSRPVSLAVIGLLLAALVLIFLPTARREEAASAPARTEPLMPPGTPATVTAPPVEVPAGESPTQRVTFSEPAIVPKAGDAAPAAAAVATAPGAAPTAPATAAAPAAQTAAAKPAAAPSVAATATATVAGVAPAAPVAASEPAASGVIVFKTRARSWVQVVDAKGNTVLRRLMEGGESAGASGSLPLSVTVGSAEATDVQVRGKAFDLGPVTRDNVARFDVK